jgi:hypothetical protein
MAFYRRRYRRAAPRRGYWKYVRIGFRLRRVWVPFYSSGTRRY